MKRHPLVVPLVVGGVLRLVAAFWGMGFFASDDYIYVIEPAARWLEDADRAFPSGYRSELFPRVFWVLLELARNVGIEDRADALRLAYACLGLFSLLAIPAGHRLGLRSGNRAGVTVAWLLAIHALMPRFSTRALIEMVAAVPLIWAAWFFSHVFSGPRGVRVRDAFWAGLLMGVASMVRFQVGLVFIAALMGAALIRPNDDDRARWPAVLGLLAGGLPALLAQGFLDLGTKGSFLSAPLFYLRYNLEHSSSHGTSGWFTYVLMFFLLTVPPLTIWLVESLWESARAHATTLYLWFSFVLVHSLIPHKEERFMFTVLPLFLVLLGVALALAWERGGWGRRAAAAFWVLNAVALVFVTLSDGQRNVTVPLTEAAREHPAPRFAAVGKGAAPGYYLGAQGRILPHPHFESLMEAVEAGRQKPTHVLLRDKPPIDARRRLQAAGVSCEPWEIYPGDPADRLVVWVNARPNKRRWPTYVSRCDS